MGKDMVGFFVFIASLGIGLLFGALAATDIHRQRAIDAGAAYYSCDSATGDCEFTWNSASTESDGRSVK